MKRRNPSNSAQNTSAASPGKRRSADSGHRGALSLQSGWLVAAALAIIALAAVAAYCNTFAVPLLLDDPVWISSNTNIRHLWPIWQVLYPPHDPLVRGRPIVSLTLAINYALGGTNVWGYHAMNLAIHVMAAWALFGVVRRTLLLPKLRERFSSAATPLALAAAILWMLHPLQTESVTYIIQRTEALAGLFYLLTLYSVIRAATSSRSMFWYVAATASCLLGMATKELVVTAPVIVLLYDRTFLAGSFREAWRRRYGLYLALAATWCMIAFSMISTGFYGGTAGFGIQKFTAWRYLVTQSGVILHYLRLSFWPSELCFDYGWSPAQGLNQIVLPGLVVIGLLGLTAWAIVRRPAWGFLGAWFFVILAPTSSIMPIQDVAFEHRMYLSLAAVVVGVVIGAWLAGRWFVDRGTIRPAVLSVVGASLGLFAAIAFGTLTYQRNTDYRTALSIWQDTVFKSPKNDRALTNYGEVLRQAGQLDEAIAQYEKALIVNPHSEVAHNNLGKVLAGRGRLDEAIAHYHQAMNIAPRSELAYNNLGVALARQSKFDEAIASYRKALELKPDFAEAHDNLGLALAKQGRTDEAIAEYRQALALRPDYPEGHTDLGVALLRQNRLDEAILHFRRAIELKPDDADAHNNMGAALQQAGQIDEAIAYFRRAVQIEPDFAEARQNLANALGHQGKTK